MVAQAGNSDAADGLAAFAHHHSGYVREAALQRCVALADPALLGIVAGRLNDWVPAVRRRARAGIMEMLPLATPAQLSAVTPLILRVQGAGGARHAEWLEWLQQFEAALLRYLPTADLISALQGKDRALARACAQLLQRHAVLPPAALIGLLLGGRDDILLVRQGAALIASLPTAEQASHFLVALRSRFGAVRMLALQALLAMPAVDRMPVAVTALDDVQGAVRGAAMRFLSASGYDLRAHFRAALLQQPAGARKTAIRLGALASLGRQEDAEFVKSFLSNRTGAVRVAALSAWFKLKGSDKDLIAATAVADPSPAVLQFALLMVRKHGAFVPMATIRQSLQAKRNVRLLLRFLEDNKWECLEGIARLSLSSSSADAAAIDLHGALRAWCFRRTQWYGRLEPAQAAFLTSPAVRLKLHGLLDPDDRKGNDYLRHELDALAASAATRS